MTGVVVAAHGKLAEALLESAALIVGKPEKTAAVTLMPGDGPEDIKKAMLRACEEVSRDGDVLVLLDLFGGTPCNTAAVLLRDTGYECVTGVNLPMVLEVLINREKGLSAKDLVSIASDAGSSGIVDVRSRLKLGTS